MENYQVYKSRLGQTADIVQDRVWAADDGPVIRMPATGLADGIKSAAPLSGPS